MSRGSTFALYRAYTKFKVPEETLKRVVAKGVAEARKELGIDASLTDCQLAERLPPILSAYECPNHVPYQIDPDPETVEDYRLRYHTSTFLLKERLWCDRILSWNFGSMFDALIHHWGMGYYGVNTMLLVSEEEAKKILAAAEYLLSGGWTVKTLSPANEYVDILASGNSVWSYSKYVRRRKVEREKRVHTFSDAGCKVTVELPVAATQSDDAEDEADDSGVESDPRLLASALHTFLEADNWASDRETKLVLAYETWG